MPRNRDLHPLARDDPKHHDNEPDSPEPEPSAPPVIILSTPSQGGVHAGGNELEAVPGPRRQMTFNTTDTFPALRSNRYNLRDKNNERPGTIIGTANRDSATPNIDPSPPQSRERAASSSPPNTTPPHSPPMGSKISKVKETASGGKLQPSQAKADKRELEPPKNYYTHRAKSQRRKAGGNDVSATGSGGGLN